MDETIQFLKAALTPVTAVTAVIGCWIAFRQYHTKQFELRLARYDKRFKVYQALKDFISAVISERRIPSQYLKDLLAKKESPKPIKTSSKRTTQNSVLKDLGGKSTEGVAAKRFEWLGTIGFKFSVANQLRQPIRSAKFLVIFYDSDDQPLDFKFVTLEQVIPAGLATWTGPTFVDLSTGKICSPGDKYSPNPKPGRWEVRVLGFELVEEQ